MDEFNGVVYWGRFRFRLQNRRGAEYENLCFQFNDAKIAMLLKLTFDPDTIL